MATQSSEVPLRIAPGWGQWLRLGLAVMLGAALGALALWAWLPGLRASLGGATPKAYWYLSRSSAFAAYGLLWLSMASGLALTNRLARLWPGGPTAYDVHQYSSLLGLALALVHAAVLLGDGYLNYAAAQLLLPFASAPYRPLWVGLGQLAFYALIPVTLSFYARRWLGPRAWRWVHALSVAAFLLALVHGVFSGTDSPQPLIHWLYWATGGSVLFLAVYRALLSVAGPRTGRKDMSG
jgi:predicted ferric reductase